MDFLEKGFICIDSSTLLEIAGFEHAAVTSSEKLYLHCSRISQQVLLLDAVVEQVLQEPVSNNYLSWHLSRPEDTHRRAHYHTVLSLHSPFQHPLSSLSSSDQ